MEIDHSSRKRGSGMEPLEVDILSFAVLMITSLLFLLYQFILRNLLFSISAALVLSMALALTLSTSLCFWLWLTCL